MHVMSGAFAGAGGCQSQLGRGQVVRGGVFPTFDDDNKDDDFNVYVLGYQF